MKLLDHQLLVDTHALFAGEEVPDTIRPTCLLAEDDHGWMRTFLRPMLEASGYRCVDRLDRGDTAAVALTLEDDADVPGLPTLRLRRDVPTGGTADAGIYRYDRAGLLEAIARHVAAGRAG